MLTISCSASSSVRVILLALALCATGCGERPDIESAPMPDRPGARVEADAAPPAPAAAIAGWIRDADEALALARKTQRPVLVYVCPEPQGCPAARHLDAGVLADEAAAALAPDIVPLRICTGDGATESAQALLRRLAFRLLPALGVLTPTGEVVHRQYAGLYPAFDEQGNALPGAWGPMLTLDDLRTMVRTALERHAALERRAQDLADAKTAQQRVERAALLEELGRTSESIALLEGAADDLEAGRLLVRLYEDAGRHADAATRYDRLARDHAEHEDAELWRSRAAHHVLAEHPPTKDDAPAAVVAALDTLETLRTSARRSRVRIASGLSLAGHSQREGDDAALRAQLTWLATQVEGSKTLAKDWTPAMLFELHTLEALPDPVWMRRSAAHVSLLLETFPDSFEAQQVKHGVLGLLRMMAEQPPVPPDR